MQAVPESELRRRERAVHAAQAGHRRRIAGAELVPLRDAGVEGGLGVNLRTAMPPGSRRTPRPSRLIALRQTETGDLVVLDRVPVLVLDDLGILAVVHTALAQRHLPVARS